MTAAAWLFDTECDTWTNPRLLTPLLFGVPQDRERLRFPSYRRKALRDLNLSDGEAYQLLYGVAQRLVGRALGNFDEYVF